MGLIHDQDTPIASGSRQGALIALQVFFVLAALIVYLLRLYTRAKILRSTGNDDYVMGGAVIFSVALAVNACVSTEFGWGKHLDEVPTSDFGPIRLFIWLSELLFTLSTSLVKISILLFYLRIAVTATYRRIIYASIAFIAVWTIVFSSVVIFQCHPVSAYWDPSPGQCYPPEAALFIHGLTNTITDIYIYILPMKMVWKTHLPRRQRIGLLVIFGAGFLVCLSGAIRLYYSIATENSNDSTWEGFGLWSWESIEVNLGIVCASAPCLKALMARLAPKFMASHSASSMSHKPAPQYQMNARQNIGNQPDCLSESLGRIRRAESRVYGSGESQDGLTEAHQHVLMAKVDVGQLV